MIIHGSLNHYPSGRRKKKLQRGRKTKQPFSTYVPTAVYRRETPNYPSVTAGKAVTSVTESDYKKEISKKYTVAVPYNKGAYQVISVENIKDIGK